MSLREDGQEVERERKNISNYPNVTPARSPINPVPAPNSNALFQG
uniref:Uncharacterized protein n=1 Tax=Lepeophtheirus salmonis TaxID=72036 RepID=A0A0K2UYU9_LEPSM